MRQTGFSVVRIHHFIGKGVTGSLDAKFTPEIIPVRLKLARGDGYPPVDCLCGLKCFLPTGIIFPVGKVIITGDHQTGVRPLFPHRLGHVEQIVCRYGGDAPAFTKASDGDNLSNSFILWKLFIYFLNPLILNLLICLPINLRLFCVHQNIDAYCKSLLLL